MDRFLRFVMFYVKYIWVHLDTFGLGQVMFEYDLYPIYFPLLLTNFIYIKSFFIAIIIK